MEILNSTYISLFKYFSELYGVFIHPHLLDNWHKHQGDGMADTKTLVGKRIRSLRKLNDLSQEQLGERANISAKYVGEVERGKANFTIDILEKISTALNANLPDLFDFHHELRRGEIKNEINSLIKDASDQDLHTIFRIFKSILK